MSIGIFQATSIYTYNTSHFCFACNGILLRDIFKWVVGTTHYLVYYILLDFGKYQCSYSVYYMIIMTITIVRLIVFLVPDIVIYNL